MAIKTKKKNKSTTPDIKSDLSLTDTNKQVSLKPFIGKLLLIITIGTLIFLGVQKYRGLFVAGMVDSSIITRSELNNRLLGRYGQATLDEIVSERVLENAIKKENIVITDADIDAEISSNEAQFGGPEALKEAAKGYGLKSDKEIRQFFRYRVMVRLLQENLFDVEVTDEEVQEYYDTNKEYLADNKFEDVAEDIRSQIKTQKVQAEFSVWFQQLKSEVKVQSFL
jgi:hypothetical protein